MRPLRCRCDPVHLSRLDDRRRVTQVPSACRIFFDRDAPLLLEYPRPISESSLWPHLLLLSPVVIFQDDRQSLSRDVWTAGLAHGKHWMLWTSCCQSQRFMLSKQLQLKLMRPLNFWEVDFRNTQSHSSLSHPRGLLGWVSFPLCCLNPIYRLHSILYFSTLSVYKETMFRTFGPAWISLIITQLFLIFLQFLVRYFYRSVAVPSFGGSGVWRQDHFVREMAPSRASH